MCFYYSRIGTGLSVSLRTRLPVTAIPVMLVCLLPATAGYALDNGLALTPPMGWNSWNRFECDGINEEVVRQVAEAMATNGMRDAGYLYVCIDDCWSISRDANGRLVPDPSRFPSGIASLADYVHSLGLKLGIYSDAGTGTCQHRPGSKGYEYIDAQTFADWGVDYIKHDWCETYGMDAPSSYSLMRDAILATGRPMVFSICEWGVSEPWLWAGDVGHLWRTTLDIKDNWETLVRNIDQNSVLYPYAGPGHWNDPDMLEVGNGGMTPTEYKSHFSLWCIMAAPLIAGNDIVNMSQSARDILLNAEAIAVDQDPLGIQGRKVRDDGDYEVWMKPLIGDELAVVLFNRSASSATLTADWSDLGLPADHTSAVRDLWEHADKGSFSNAYSTQVDPHGVVMLRLSVPQIPSPANLHAVVTSTDPITIELTWQDQSSGDDQEDRFVIQRKVNTPSSFWQQIGTAPADSTIYTDTSILHGLTEYLYRAGAERD